MDISEIIKQGKDAVEKCKHSGSVAGFEYYSGPEYANWLASSTRYVEKNYPGDTDTKRYREIAEKAEGQHIKDFNDLIAILEAFKLFPPEN